MNLTLQPGMHPDADTLTAFAEQLLPAREREQVLLHAAVCSRCREVIFLAQQAGADEAVTSPSTTAPSEKPRASWFEGWRWTWVPVGALAALIGVAVVLHFGRASKETQLARNNSSNEAPQQSPMPAQQSSPSQSVGAPQPKTAESSVLEKNKPELARDDLAVRQKEEVLDRKGTMKQGAGSFGAAGSEFARSSGVSGGAIHGALAARAPSTPYDGPMANQLQQNTMQQQNAAQQNAVQNVLQAAPRFDRKPTGNESASTPAPASASETVTVETDAAKASPMAPLPATVPQISDELKARSLEISPVATAQLKKASKVSLPGGAQLLSVAYAADRAIAIDTSGALFLSEDQGKHWQPVTTQWTGRAVLVRNTQRSKDKADFLQGIAPVGFQLVNDKLQTWKSPDGKTWTAETTPGK
jgi:hypothetical protein